MIDDYRIAVCLIALLAVSVVGLISISSLRIRIGSGRKPRPAAVRKRRVEVDRTTCECGRRLVIERYCTVCDTDKEVER